MPSSNLSIKFLIWINLVACQPFRLPLVSLILLYSIIYLSPCSSNLNTIVLDCFELCLKSNCPSSFKGEILQALSLLLQNLKQPDQFLTFSSNNRLTSILELSYDITDGDLVSYYVTVLRSLAFRLTQQMIPMFFTQVCTHPSSSIISFTSSGCILSRI